MLTDNKVKKTVVAQKTSKAFNKNTVLVFFKKKLCLSVMVTSRELASRVESECALSKIKDFSQVIVRVFLMLQKTLS